MTEATVDDIIVIEDEAGISHNFPVRGVVRVNATAEFESGVKIGAATYDHREHAFFLVIDDWSGGLGYRRLDVRGTLGTYWYSGRDNAIDTRRSGHLTLPPRQTSQTLSAIQSDFEQRESVTYELNHLTQGNEGRMRIAMGNSIVRTADGVSFEILKTVSDPASKHIRAIVPFPVNIPNHLYLQMASPHAAAVLGDRYLIHGMAGYRTGRGSEEQPASSFLFWDNKLLSLGIHGIRFAVWVDNAEYYAAPSISGGVGVGNGPGGLSIDEPTQIDGLGLDGVLPGSPGGLDPNNGATEKWNTSNENDGQVVSPLPDATRWRMCQWVGVLPSPWGEPAPYFTDGYGVYVLDFFARKIYPVNIGMGRRWRSFCIWNGSLVCSDGWNVWEYNPAGTTVRDIGPPNNNMGIAPNLRGEINPTVSHTLMALMPAGPYLFATAVNFTENVSVLMCYNGVGWHQVGKPIEGVLLRDGVIGSFDTNISARRIILWGSKEDGTTHVETYYLPSETDVPEVGVYPFGDSNATAISGWIDGGFSDLFGTLFRMDIDAWSMSPTSTCKIEYRLNNNETEAAWVQMGDVENVADVFDDTTRHLYFRSANPLKGIEFRTVQFRVTLTRGDNDTDSPEVRALTLVYLKQPEFRSSWTVQIDVNRMLERSKTGLDTTFYVTPAGGAAMAATTLNVWRKLKELWSQHVLLKLTIPSAEPDGIYVKIADMPMTFDDFRSQVGGKGTVTLTFIEPTETPSA